MQRPINSQDNTEVEEQTGEHALPGNSTYYYKLKELKRCDIDARRDKTGQQNKL